MARTTPQSAPAPALPLVTTKLYVPPARANLVARPQLLERLQTALMNKLTLISAPAGFGKTTLISAWLYNAKVDTASDPTIVDPQSAIRNPHVAWVSLDSADNDSARFWSYVLTAIDTHQPGVVADALPALQFTPAPPLEGLLAQVLNDLTALEIDVILVLDDYHVIDSPPIHHALTFVLDHLPPRLHLVITTRADPPLPLARLRARGELTELRAADLRFTPSEVATFFTTVMGLPLTTGEVAALEARTEGWIAGLQLAALAMHNRADRASFVAAFTGSHRFVVDYLASEVLDRLPIHLQRFVLQTSILERLCGPLCDALVIGETEESKTERIVNGSLFSVLGSGDSYSQMLLLELERINLFVIPLDDDRRWYRYHHLFGDVLRERLQRAATAAEVATLHRHASAWFAQHMLIPEAVQHALAAEDWEYAAYLIEQHSRPIIVSGQVATVLHWIEAIPAALIAASPRLATIHAALLTYTGQFDAAETRLRNAEDWVQASTPPDQARLVLGQVGTVRGTLLRFTGDLTRSVASAQQALSILPESEVIGRSGAMITAAHGFLVDGDVTAAVEQALLAIARPAQAAGNMFAILRGITLAARLYGVQGRLTEAAARYQQAVHIVPNQEAGLQVLLGGADYYAGLGDLLRERNDLDHAERLLRQCLTLLQGMFAIEAESITIAYLGLARIQQARGEHADALATLQQFFDLTRQRRFFEGLIRRGAAVQARIWLAQGHLDAAVAWATSCGLQAADEISYFQEAEYLTLARVQIAQRRHSASHSLATTLAMLERLLTAAEQGARIHSVIETLTVRALAWQTNSQMHAALIDLQRALTLAEPEGYVRIFVDEGTPMATLLHAAQQRGIMPLYVARLLACFNHGDAQPTGSQRSAISRSLPEPLSDRELEVLRLIADGHSNQVIADRLVVAISTVKKHVNNIYGKLDVRSRTQALVRAKALNLL